NHVPELYNIVRSVSRAPPDEHTCDSEASHDRALAVSSKTSSSVARLKQRIAVTLEQLITSTPMAARSLASGAIRRIHDANPHPLGRLPSCLPCQCSRPPVRCISNPSSTIFLAPNVAAKWIA